MGEALVCRDAVQQYVHQGASCAVEVTAVVEMKGRNRSSETDFWGVLRTFCVCVCMCSSLEDCVAAQGSTGIETLRQDLERTATKLHFAETSEVQLKAELACLKER